MPPAREFTTQGRNVSDPRLAHEQATTLHEASSRTVHHTLHFLINLSCSTISFFNDRLNTLTPLSLQERSIPHPHDQARFTKRWDTGARGTIIAGYPQPPESPNPPKHITHLHHLTVNRLILDSQLGQPRRPRCRTRNCDASPQRDAKNPHYDVKIGYQEENKQSGRGTGTRPTKTGEAESP